MTGRLRLALTLILFTPGLRAQTPVTRPAFDSFEVATVKPTPHDWTGGRWMRMETTRQFVAHGYQMRVLIGAAWDLPPSAISGGPGWLDSDLYDIAAKVAGDARPTREEQMAMLRNLIAERFQLAFHRAPKELPVYELTVAKGGPKFRESQPVTSPEGPPPVVFVIAPPLVRLPGRAASMSEVTAVLQRTALDRPVIDKTGLTGRYDFDLEFTPDESQFGGMVKVNPDEAAKPGLFAALEEQLGLHLAATRGTISTMVVDRIERPSGN